MGGNIKSADISNEKVQMFYNVFSKLKQKIIWKWESNVVPPGKPDNVYIIQWIPQADLLAQPKVKCFISHCGIGGIYEAKYYGVPILGMVFIFLFLILIDEHLSLFYSQNYILFQLFSQYMEINLPMQK